MIENSPIAERINYYQAQIAKACHQYHRQAAAVTLLAVTKTQPLTAIQAAYDVGLRCFGESYIQEALPKIHAFNKLDIEWHFIGPIQSNKTKAIAEQFSWVHSICRSKVAQRLNDQRPGDLPPLNVCLQINSKSDPNKAGISYSELQGLATKIKQLPNLCLRGLMTIPDANLTTKQQHQIFRQLQQASAELNQQGFELDCLSMGMTDDYLAAIAEGSTIIRIGSGIFGPRNYVEDKA